MLFVGDMYMTHTEPNVNILYCPLWFMKSEMFIEVLRNYNHYQSQNLSAFWSGGNMPHALERAISAFQYGYQKGYDARPKKSNSD